MVQTWISTKERLPTVEGKYLIAFKPKPSYYRDKDGNRQIKKRRYGKWKIFVADWEDNDFWVSEGSPPDIRFWMEIPALPETKRHADAEQKEVK